MGIKGYKIGEVSRITGITIETLRHYDRKGILSPSYVDPVNGYRYYTYDQFWCFDIIKVCRRLGVSLDKVREILNTHDNDKVVSLLMEEQSEAERLSREYAKIASDISWYRDQQDLISRTVPGESVEIKHFPMRKVLMGDDREERRVYHLRLQELCMKAGQPLNALRRQYGFVIDPEGIQHDKFTKIGEFIQYEDVDIDKVPEEYITVLPEGDYACFIHFIVNDDTDFSIMRKWISDNNIECKYVISDEVGLQLFQYLDHGYLCETKILIQ